MKVAAIFSTLLAIAPLTIAAPTPDSQLEAREGNMGGLGPFGAILGDNNGAKFVQAVVSMFFKGGDAFANGPMEAIDKIQQGKPDQAFMGALDNAMKTFQNLPADYQAIFKNLGGSGGGGLPGFPGLPGGGAPGGGGGSPSLPGFPGLPGFPYGGKSKGN